MLLVAVTWTYDSRDLDGLCPLPDLELDGRDGCSSGSSGSVIDQPSTQITANPDWPRCLPIIRTALTYGNRRVIPSYVSRLQ